MKRNIILSGVGGQGILSIAAVIGRAALEDGLHIKQAEVHGMSQRGGDRAVEPAHFVVGNPFGSHSARRGRSHRLDGADGRRCATCRGSPTTDG